MKNLNHTLASLLDHKQNTSSNTACRLFLGNVLFTDYTQQHNFLKRFNQEISFNIQEDNWQKAGFLTVQSRSFSNTSVLYY